MNTTTKKHPLHVIQHGAVRAAIWEMGGAGQITFAISLSEAHRGFEWLEQGRQLYGV